MNTQILKTKSGEVAIMLVLIIVTLTIITTAAVGVAISTSRDTTTLSLGEKALAVAESGAENALLRLLRDPGYTGEVTPLSIGSGNATIGVVGTSPFVITSTGVVDNMIRTIEVQANIVAGELIVASWKEL